MFLYFQFLLSYLSSLCRKCQKSAGFSFSSVRICCYSWFVFIVVKIFFILKLSVYATDMTFYSTAMSFISWLLLFLIKYFKFFIPSVFPFIVFVTNVKHLLVIASQMWGCAAFFFPSHNFDFLSHNYSNVDCPSHDYAFSVKYVQLFISKIPNIWCFQLLKHIN